tara:strand:- start:3899 stop:5947 length:2049 start_codon:yes stop_codon:yes gene_type:complete
MVVSNIDKTITYTENKTLDERDTDHTATMFVAEIHDQNCLIALGNLNKTFEAKDIFHIPIYLVDGNDVISKIGVFEFNKDKEPIIYDAEMDYDLDKFDEPLLFSFATKQFIIEKTASLEIPEISKEEGISIPEDEDEEGEESNKAPSKSPSKISSKFPFEDDSETLVDIQTSLEAKQEVQQYDEKTAGINWLQKFMKNNNYDIENVPGNGDCFFTVLKEAFIGIPLQIHTDELREILSNHADEETLQTRIERFKMFKNEHTKAKLATKQANKNYKDEQKRLLDEFDKNKKLAKENKADPQKAAEYLGLYKAAKDEWKRVKPDLKKVIAKKVELEKIAFGEFTPYRIMDGVTTMDQFVDVIKSSNFWADEWAIKKLEGLLNIKMIILSKEKYDEGEVEGVLQCGGEFPEHIKAKGTFKPAYYIIAEFSGNHYNLIKYKDRRVFKFNELPLDIKTLIKTKCMETSSQSEWNFIQKFRNLVESKVESKESLKEASPPTKGNLFNENTVFQFYSRSANAKPGKGSGEKIPAEREEEFKDLKLKENKDWRKVLSNFYISPIQIDGKRWNSVEHYYQGSKFKKENQEYYEQFSLDHPTSTFKEDPGKAKSAGSGKGGKPQADSDFFGPTGRSSKEMKKAQMEKYKTNAHARKILLLTKDAKLTHYLGRGQGTVDFTETMEIRKELQSK